MNEAAPAILVALEGSGLGQAIRQSVWLYPTANVAHVVALTVFAGAVAVMDLRLLGAFAGSRPAEVIRPARRAAMAGLLLMLLTGTILFTAEASHVSLNPVFQLKAMLIGLGVANALVLGRMPSANLANLASMEANVALPRRVRVAAGLSLCIWLAVAACGRLIAYY